MNKVEENFRKDLQALLNKYNAEIEVIDTWFGYDHTSKMEVYIEPQYDYSGDKVKEGATFDLGTIQTANSSSWLI